MGASLIGTRLADRYELVAVVGDELLGSVYRARDARDGGWVAVKILDPELTDNREKFGRFGREITASWAIVHPNTVEVLDWGRTDELHFLVMAYHPARTLAQELERSGPLSVARAASIAAQIASAIGAAQQEGIQHRGLAPGNVLLLDNAATGDFVKVRDFGLSKTEKADDQTFLTTATTQIGYASYVAPEYIRTNKAHVKGDLYGLGAILFAMLTGRPPYEGDAVEVVTRQVSEDPPRVRQVAPAVPAWMDELVASLLSREPHERPGAYKVIGMLESGMGRRLEPPRLLPLDDEGRPIEDRGAAPWAVAAGAALLVGGALAATTAAVAATAAVAITLSLPS